MEAHQKCTHPGYKEYYPVEPHELERGQPWIELRVRDAWDEDHAARYGQEQIGDVLLLREEPPPPRQCRADSPDNFYAKCDSNSELGKHWNKSTLRFVGKLKGRHTGYSDRAGWCVGCSDGLERQTG
jgi:hypothetical protein